MQNISYIFYSILYTKKPQNVNFGQIIRRKEEKE